MPPEKWYEPAEDHDGNYSVIEQTAGTGFRHILTETEIRERLAQLRALETYWYLRLVEPTPRIEDLYASLFPSQRARREAYGLTSDALRDLVEEDGLDAVLRRVADDEDFAHAHKLDALRESLGLAYPSWILALAMGAGKTVLVAAHGNSLRALVKHLDGIGEDTITELNIPTGIPLVYHLDENLLPMGSPDDAGVRGRYAGDAQAAAAAAAAVKAQAG